jgi:C4-dicarboxylate-specific signal transduction histidine kinase
METRMLGWWRVSCQIRGRRTVEQLLINILHNAVDASRKPRNVVVGCRALAGAPGFRGDGTGVMNPGNLFVPFFTTKPGAEVA